MKKITIIFLAIVSFISLVIFISSKYMSDEALSHDGHIPDYISAYTLVNKIENDEAKKIVDKIHSRAADVDKAYVLEYQTNGESYAIVWISEFKQNNIAMETYKSIEENLTMENREISNRPVLYQRNEADENFYFVNGNRFVLVKTFKERRELFIKNAIKIF